MSDFLSIRNVPFATLLESLFTAKSINFVPEMISEGQWVVDQIDFLLQDDSTNSIDLVLKDKDSSLRIEGWWTPTEKFGELTFSQVSDKHCVWRGKGLEIQYQDEFVMGDYDCGPSREDLIFCLLRESKDLRLGEENHCKLNSITRLKPNRRGRFCKFHVEVLVSPDDNPINVICNTQNKTYIHIEKRNDGSWVHTDLPGGLQALQPDSNDRGTSTVLHTPETVA